jgi:1-acyl-sn-glycerol-3-phosphate acyltransferase
MDFRDSLTYFGGWYRHWALAILDAVSTSIRLISLWLSQAARILADGCVCLLAIFAYAGASAEANLSTWPVVLGVFVAPFLVLAPLNGCISNALPRRWVLAGSAAFSLVAVVLCAVLGVPWTWYVGIVALGAALSSAARHAMLPAAGRDAGMALPRLSGWMELGAALAWVSSVYISVLLTASGAPAIGSTLAVLVGLNFISFAGAIPASFPSDTHRPEPSWEAMKGFFRDAGRIVLDRSSVLSLLALSSFQALVTAGAGTLIAHSLDRGNGGLDSLISALVLAGVGGALGSATAAFVAHPRRCLGLVPLSAAGLVGTLGWAMMAPSESPVPATMYLRLGFAGGLFRVPLRATYLASLPADARGNGASLMNMVVYGATVILAGATVALTTAPARLGMLTVLAAVATVATWRVLWMPAMELVLEGLIRPFYRIRAHGPGKNGIPATGPLLIVANHSTYVDPFFLGKVAPRRLTPMMLSTFYDKPFLRWLMRHVVGAIRVEKSPFRREAPELREAIAALDRGEAVLLFPEGILRRKEEQLLRPFGRGVWHILNERPTTPVVVCWVEGGWGSYASYKGGPPFVKKRLDFNRQIDVAIAEPEVLPAEVLADHRRARVYLWRACLACRRYRGLEVPAEGPAEEDGLEADRLESRL